MSTLVRSQFTNVPLFYWIEAIFKDLARSKSCIIKINSNLFQPCILLDLMIANLVSLIQFKILKFKLMLLSSQNPKYHIIFSPTSYVILNRLLYYNTRHILKNAPSHLEYSPSLLCVQNSYQSDNISREHQMII